MLQQHRWTRQPDCPAWSYEHVTQGHLFLLAQITSLHGLPGLPFCLVGLGDSYFRSQPTFMNKSTSCKKEVFIQMHFCASHLMETPGTWIPGGCGFNFPQIHTHKSKALALVTSGSNLIGRGLLDTLFNLDVVLLEKDGYQSRYEFWS